MDTHTGQEEASNTDTICLASRWMQVSLLREGGANNLVRIAPKVSRTAIHCATTWAARASARLDDAAGWVQS